MEVLFFFHESLSKSILQKNLMSKNKLWQEFQNILTNIFKKALINDKINDLTKKS